MSQYEVNTISARILSQENLFQPSLQRQKSLTLEHIVEIAKLWIKRVTVLDTSLNLLRFPQIHLDLLRKFNPR